MDKKKETKIVDISQFSRHLPDKILVTEDTPVEDILQRGLEAFNESAKESAGFLAITLDEDGTPTIVWAGNVDTISVLGALEVSKTLFIEKNFGSEG